MALFQQVVGVLVVGAEHTAIHVLAGEQGHESLQIPGGRTLTDHDVLAKTQLIHGVLHIGALVVGVDAGGDVGVEILAGKARRMAVDLLVVGLRGHDLLHHLTVAVDHAHIVHHLRQSLHTGMVIEGVDGTVIQIGAGLVQRRGGDAGGQHEAHVHRQVLCGLQHILDAVGTHDVGDLMGVGDDGGGAVGQHRLGKLRGTHQRALQMDVSVDEAGQHQLAGHVHLHLAVVFAHTYNEALCHGDVPVTQLIGEYVDVSGVFQHQIRRSPARRHVDDVELLIELTVDLAGIAFLDRHKRLLSPAGRDALGGISFIDSSYYHSL